MKKEIKDRAFDTATKHQRLAHHRYDSDVPAKGYRKPSADAKKDLKNRRKVEDVLEQQRLKREENHLQYMEI